MLVMDAIDSCKALGEVKEIVSRVVKLVKKSSPVKEKLDKYQEELGIKRQKRLIQDVPTCWNSLFAMLDRFLELKKPVTLLFTDPTVKDATTFGAPQWEIIDQAVSPLRPCYEATEELSGEKFSTGSKVIPLTKMLMSYYAKADREANDGSLTKELSQLILNNLNARFGVFEDARILAMATLLDPRFKNKCFRSQEKKKYALTCLEKELRELYKKNQQCVESKSSTELPMKKKCSGLWDDHDAHVKNQETSPGTSSDLSKVDVREYLSLPCQLRKSDALQWWLLEGKRRFPQMFKIALRYLIIPATSVPSERVFSSAGDIISKRRSCISDENARMLVCLHRNLK